MLLPTRPSTVVVDPTDCMKMVILGLGTLGAMEGGLIMANPAATTTYSTRRNSILAFSSFGFRFSQRSQGTLADYRNNRSLPDSTLSNSAIVEGELLRENVRERAEFHLDTGMPSSSKAPSLPSHDENDSSTHIL